MLQAVHYVALATIRWRALCLTVLANVMAPRLDRQCVKILLGLVLDVLTLTFASFYDMCALWT